MQKAARWPDSPLPVPHCAFRFSASSGVGPRNASTAGLLQKLIARATCISKFGTEGVFVRVIVQQNAKTRTPHLHNSNLLQHNFRHPSTILQFNTASFHITLQPSIGRFVLRGIQPLPEVRTLVHQRCKELRSSLLQVSDVAEGQVVGVMIQNDYFFACASEVPNISKLCANMHMTKGWIHARALLISQVLLLFSLPCFPKARKSKACCQTITAAPSEVLYS